MNDLIVIANPNPKAFYHSNLQQGTRGLEETGPTS